MTTSEQIGDLAAALAKAQGEMRNAALNKVNPHFKSRYADLAGIRDAVVPVLAKHGIAVVQTLGVLETQQTPAVVTRLLHASGQWIESTCPVAGGKNMQEFGSAITYARRYSLSAICGIAADEDDDANAASEPPHKGPQAITKPTPPAGFEEWFNDLDAVADEGADALKAVWQKSKPEYRKHLTDVGALTWESIKARAAKVKARA